MKGPGLPGGPVRRISECRVPKAGWVRLDDLFMRVSDSGHIKFSCPKLSIALALASPLAGSLLFSSPMR